MLDTEIVLQPCDPVAEYLNVVGLEAPAHFSQQFTKGIPLQPSAVELTSPPPPARGNQHHIVQSFHFMSTYKPKNSRLPHKPLIHSAHDTPEGNWKRWVIAIVGLLVGPFLLVGGLMATWWAVAWIIVGVFHLLPGIKG